MTKTRKKDDNDLRATVIEHGPSQTCERNEPLIKDCRVVIDRSHGQLCLSFAIPMPKGEKLINVWIGTPDIRTVLLKLASGLPELAELFADCASIATLCNLASLKEVQNPVVLEKLKTATDFVKSKYQVAANGADDKDGAISALQLVIKAFETQGD